MSVRNYVCKKTQTRSKDEHADALNHSLYANGTVAGIETSLLIDSGVTISLLHVDVWKEIQKGSSKKLKNWKTHVRSVSGNGLNALGQVCLPVCVDKFTAEHKFVVFEAMTTSCLIGMDFLLRHKCIINCVDATLEIQTPVGVIVPLNVSQSIPRVCRVSLAQQVTVPGCHEMILTAKLVRSTHQKGNVSATIQETPTGIIEPLGSFVEKQSIAVARSVSQPAAGRMLVRVLNASPSPVTLNKDTHIGTFSALGSNWEVTD